MHEKLKEVCKHIGLQKAGQTVAGLGRVAWRKTQEEPFFLSEEGTGRRLQQKDGTACISLGSLERGHSPSAADMRRNVGRSFSKTLDVD